jgi:hypothetical protein
MQIHDDLIPLSAEARPADYGIKNALAAYVRRRWPENTVKSVMREFDLSEGKARGVVFANSTFSALDHINQHTNGGPLLVAQICAAAAGRSLVAEAERAHENAQKSWETRDRGLSRLSGSLRALAGDRPGSAA